MNKKIWKTTLISAITILTTTGLLSSFLTIPKTNIALKNENVANLVNNVESKNNRRELINEMKNSNLQYVWLQKGFPKYSYIIEALSKILSVEELNGFSSLQGDLLKWISEPKLPSMFSEELSSYTTPPGHTYLGWGTTFLAPLLTSSRKPPQGDLKLDLFFWPVTATTVAENHQQFKEWWDNNRLRHFLNSFLDANNPDPFLKDIVENSPFKLKDPNKGYPFLSMGLLPMISNYRDTNDLTGKLNLEIQFSCSNEFELNGLPIPPNYDENSGSIFFSNGTGGSWTLGVFLAADSKPIDTAVFPMHPKVINNILNLNIDNKVLPVWYTPEQLKDTFAWEFTDKTLNSNFQKFNNKLVPPIEVPSIINQKIEANGTNAIKTKWISSFGEFIDFYRDIMGPNFNYNFNNLNDQNITYNQPFFRSNGDSPSIFDIMIETIIPTLTTELLQKTALISFFKANFAFMDLVATTFGLTKPVNDTSDKIFIWDNIKAVLNISDGDFEILAQYHLDRLNSNPNPLKIPPSVFGFLDNSFIINFKKLDNVESLVGTKFNIKKTSFDLTFKIQGLIYEPPVMGNLQTEKDILFDEKNVEVALTNTTLEVAKTNAVTWSLVEELLGPNSVLPSDKKNEIASQLDEGELKTILLNEKSRFWTSNFDHQPNFTINPVGIPSHPENYGKLNPNQLILPSKDTWNIDDNRGIITLPNLEINYCSNFNDNSSKGSIFNNIRIDFGGYPRKFQEGEYSIDIEGLANRGKDYTQEEYIRLNNLTKKINQEVVSSETQDILQKHFFKEEMKSETGQKLTPSQINYIRDILIDARTNQTKPMLAKISPLEGTQFTLTFTFNSLKITDVTLISFLVIFKINPTFFPINNQVEFPNKPPVVSDIGTQIDKPITPVNFGEIAIWLFPVIAISIGAILLAVYCFIQHRKKI